MRVLPAMAMLLAAGCPPPDPVELPHDTGEDAPPIPEIRILYPPDEAEFGIELQEDGTLETLVVVDILNLDFVPPTGGAEHVDGEGHWHLYVQSGEHIGAPLAMYSNLVSTSFAAGERGIISVDLRANDHTHLEELVDCACTDLVEFDVLAWSGEAR